MEDSNYYSTSDFNIASWLRYNAIPLISIEDENGRKVWIFEQNQTLETAVNDWMKGKMMIVDLQRFLAVQKFLKSTIYR